MIILYLFSLILVTLLLILLIIKKSKTKDLYAIDLETHKLSEKVYIFPLHYIHYENRISMIIYSKQNVIFKRCFVNYKKITKTCSPIFMYHGRDDLFNLYEIQTLPNKIPQSVTINNLTIRVNKSRRNNNYKIVSCYAVLSNFDRPKMLIQSIESIRYLGVSKIIIYYVSSSERVKRILNYYSSIGLVDIYRYKLDSYLKNIEINSREFPYIYHLIQFKLNHCFNEYKTDSNNMLLLDTDEILWPVNFDSYFNLINSLPKKDYYLLSSFIFKEDYNISQNDDKNVKVILPDVNIYDIKKYCYVDEDLWRKYIILNTKGIKATDIHEPIPYTQLREDYISTKVAFIRHTRIFNDVLKQRCKESNFHTNEYTKIENNVQQISEKIIKKFNLK